MKLYLVLINYDHEGFSIAGIYADKAQAERHRAALLEVGQGGDGVDVDEWEAQAAPPAWVGRVERGQRIVSWWVGARGNAERIFHDTSLRERTEWAPKKSYRDGDLYVARWAGTPEEVAAVEQTARHIAAHAQAAGVWGDVEWLTKHYPSD